MLGIGVNVGSAPWPGAGCVERDRLELLVEILDRLERGYDAWAAAAHGQLTVAPALPAASRACAVNDVTGPAVHGIVNAPARLADRRSPGRSRPRSRSPASLEVEAQRRGVEQRQHGRASCRSTTGWSSETVPSALVAVTTAT